MLHRFSENHVFLSGYFFVVQLYTHTKAVFGGLNQLNFLPEKSSN